MIFNIDKETLPREDIEALQLRRLQDLCSRVYANVPFYRKRFDESGIKPGDIKSLADLKNLPFTEKQDLRNYYPFGLFAVPRDNIVRLHASSGTTGKAVVVGYTARDLHNWAELAGRSLSAAGVNQTDIVHVAYGYGLFTGGSIPYGYRLEKRGRINKRNREVCDLTVDDDAAKIVQLIFYKYVHEGYGAQRLCRYLTELGIRKADGRNFPNTTINRIIKNPIYVGQLHNGDATSEHIPELQIIDQDTFDAAQQLMAARATHHADTPLNMKGQSLLVGNIFCGHCGNRLTLTTSGRKAIQKDGTVRREIRCRYQCHYNLRHPGECDGQSGYGVTKLDGIVEKIIRHQFAQIKMASQDDVIAQQHEKAVELARARCNMAEMQLSEKRRELEDYQKEIIKVIRGESRLNVDLLNELIDKAQTDVEALSQTAEAARQELESRTADMETEQQEYDKLKTWADLYDNCNFAAKKMIVSQFIKSVRVYRDYTLEVEFNVSFEQFQQLQAACSGGANERTNVCIEA